MLTRTSTRWRFFLGFGVLAVIVLLHPVHAHAQVTGATMTGTLTDASGAYIPNAQISIKNVSTGIERSTTTDSAGFYTLPNLLPGSYQVSATAKGFATKVETGVTLNIGAQVELNISLQVGAITQTVEVGSEAQEVQLASSNTGGVLLRNTVEDLPLNGRDWTSLALLQPGVANAAPNQANQANGNQRGNRGFGAQLPISGLTSAQNSYRIDGINVNDYVGQGPGSVAGVTLGVDAIQEFSVVTSNYSAEYGRTSGGVINATLRSGTNRFHGSAFEYLRNSALDARNFFDGSNIPPFRRNQFGGSVGGPIRKDKTFFFAAYEGLRQFLGATNSITTFSSDARNGILNFPGGPSTYPSGCVQTATANQCAVTVDPLVKPFLGLWAPPNAGLLGEGNTGVYSFSGNQTTTENFVSGRIDHTFSPKDSLFGSYQMDRSDLTLPDSTNTVLNGENSRRQLVAIEETHTFSSQLINSVRVGYNRSKALTVGSISPINPLAAVGSLTSTGNPEVGPPIMNVSGVQSFPGGMNSGTNAVFALNSYQLYDDAFLTRGKHSLKFGFALERDQNNTTQVSRLGGQFNVGSIAAFLTNQPNSYQAALPGFVTPRNLRQTIVGGYIQDDIRMLPSLTVNLGLRYEMATVPTEIANKLVNVRDIYHDTVAHLGSPLFDNPTKRDVAPRVGFNWDPFKAGKTSIRGGFGIFDSLPLQTNLFADGQSSYAPFFFSGTATNLPPGSFPTEAFALLGVSKLYRSSHTDFTPHRSYVMQWNLTVQQALSSNLTALVSYVGNHGVHMTSAAGDADMVLPTKTPVGYLWPYPVGTPVNPNFGRIDYIGWGSQSFYDALQAQITKRMSHGIQGQVSYSWSRAIDSHSAARGDDAYVSDVSSPLWFDQRVMRGPSDFNMTHNLVTYVTWNIPSPQSLHGPAAWAAGGWQLGTIFGIHGGLPFTVLVGGDPMGQNFGDPFAYPSLVAGQGCGSPINPGNPNNYLKLNCFSPSTAPASMAAVCAPNSFPGAATPPPSGRIYCQNLLGGLVRNNVIGPGLVNFDFSLFKNNYVRRISESFNAQFRLEVFNAFNRANFNAPFDNNTLFDQTGAPIGGAGRIDSTSTTSRQIQVSLRIIW